MKTMTYQDFANQFHVYFTKDKTGCWNCWSVAPKINNGIWYEDKSYIVDIDEMFLSNIDDLKNETICFPAPQPNDLVFVWNEDIQIANIRRFASVRNREEIFVFMYEDGSKHTISYANYCPFFKEDAGKTGGQLKIERGLK